jgi:hypothetical protein
MAVTRLTTNGLTGTKYDTVSADNYYMEPIATTLLSSTAATITFDNIPQGYKHLQIRWIARSNRTVSPDYLKLNFNGDTGANYSWHYLIGAGSSALASSSVSASFAINRAVAGAAQAASVFGTGIADILDYSNVYKYKTARTLGGYDNNGDGEISLQSGLWMNTAAVTTITITPGAGTLISANSRFSLYGIRG